MHSSSAVTTIRTLSDCHGGRVLLRRNVHPGDDSDNESFFVQEDLEGIVPGDGSNHRESTKSPMGN